MFSSSWGEERRSGDVAIGLDILFAVDVLSFVIDVRLLIIDRDLIRNDRRKGVLVWMTIAIILIPYHSHFSDIKLPLPPLTGYT